MRFNNLPPKSHDFLKKFYGDENYLKWEEITKQKISKEVLDLVRPWIDDLKTQNEPVVLPRYISEDEIEWYAISFSSVQSRVLKENIDSFVGPTYTNFNGQLAELNPGDPIERAILDYMGPYSYRFSANNKEYNKNVWDSLALMRRILKKQPVRVTKVTRPIGRILRDFEEALRQGNGDTADQFISELHNEGRLSIPNMAFLRIKFFACTDKWKELLLIPQLTTILDIPRPTLISQYIIKAIYKTFLTQFEKENNPQRAIEYFKENIFTKYLTLFRSRGPIKDPEVLKAFMINLAVSNNPHQESLDKILNDYPLDSEGRPYLEALTQFVKIKEQPVEDDFTKAQLTYFDGDADLALHILLNCQPDLKSTKLILRCARDINSLESAKIAIDFMAKCPENAREEILSLYIFSKIWDELNIISNTEETSPESSDIPNNWLDWVKKLNEDSYWASAIQVADQGKTEWNIEDYTENPVLIDDLCDLLSYDRIDQNNESLHNSMPHLVEFFIDEGKAHNVLKKLYFKLIELIVYDDQILTTDLNAVYEFVLAILQIGCSKNEYHELVAYLKEIWERKKAPDCFGWGLDTLDALINYSAPDTKIREDFFSSIIGSFSQYIRRIHPEQWNYFEYLCKDLNHQDFFNDLRKETVSDEDSKLEEILSPDVLKDKLIGIYTLNDPVGIRVKTILEKRFSGVKVKLNNAHVANDSLATIAREADIFLFAWRSAKHSAFDCIEDNRPKNKVTLKPNGKGSSRYAAYLV